MSRAAEVWITGAEAITAAGRGLEVLWSAVKAGEVQTRLTEFPEGHRACTGFFEGDPAEGLPRRLRFALDRSGRLLVRALFDALESAGLDSGGSFEQPERWGVFTGSSMGPMGAALEAHHRWEQSKKASPGDVIRCAHGVPAAVTAGQLGLVGPVSHFSCGSVSSSSAIGQGWMQIATGQLDACLVAGFEAPTSPPIAALFDSVGVLSGGGPADFRPFDEARQGIHLGEAAAALVLESAEHARRRGARPLGRLRGYGEAGEGTLCLAGPDPNGVGLIRAIESALAGAGLETVDVDILHLHGTATALHDCAEYRALAEVFGVDELKRKRATAIKPITGHPLGACGAVEACVSLMVLEEQCVPPVANLAALAPDAPVPVSSEARSGRADIALIMAAGFGGRDAALVLETRRSLEHDSRGQSRNHFG